MNRTSHYLERREPWAGDVHRPRYHFLPPANWMNDPNGLIDWNDQVHLFYQHNPDAPHWGHIVWGHATSPDLVHWIDRPLALVPEPGGPDEDGCWSGCAVAAGGAPAIIYSGYRADRQRPCLATGSADLLEWRRFEGNPVIPDPPAALDLTGFRDHTVWREEDGWHMGIGAGIHGAGGAVLHYRSDDLRRWKYLGPLFAAGGQTVGYEWTGTMWECPDFFRLDSLPVLIFSLWHEGRTVRSLYLTGEYERDQFRPCFTARLDYGDEHFYAPQSMTDHRGRRLAWGWIQEARSAAAQEAAGWSGVMSLPRVLAAGQDGRLAFNPAVELQTLRDEHTRLENLELRLEPGPVAARGQALEIEAILDPGSCGQSGLLVRRSPGGEEETRIYLDQDRRLLVCDRQRSSLDPGANRWSQSGPLELEPGEPLRLRIFLDHSVIEIFANERACLTSRIYPTRADSLELRAYAAGGPARLVSLDAWAMRSIWEFST